MIRSIIPADQLPATDRATIDDLYRVKAQAELVGGRIIVMSPVGAAHNLAAGEIYAVLRNYVRRKKQGKAFTDNLGYRVPPLPGSERESFSPDASYYDGPLPPDMTKFVDGPPTFAVEVRSPEEYGPAAEEEMAAKREDYFNAGTLVVWDVDLRNQLVAVYRKNAPGEPEVFQVGEKANAKPALTRWSMAVKQIMDAAAGEPTA